MYLVAWLRHGVYDRQPVGAAAAHHVDSVALSTFSLRSLPRGGLVLGYSGYDGGQIRRAVKQLCAGLERMARESISYGVPAHIADNDLTCRPRSSKFAGANHRSSRAFRMGHSASVIEYHAVSRLRPLTIMCWRKMPSNVNPSRSAAAR